MSKLYTINSDYLEQLINQISSSTVGKVLKRHEICSNPDILKKEVKEILYEQFRSLKDLLEAHQYGFEQSVFVFKSNEEKGKKIV